MTEPALAATPSVTQLADLCDRELRAAARVLWPDRPVELLDPVPGVTCYVRRVRIDGRPLYAKVSLLGMSLVSVLQGRAGPMSAVRSQQIAYAARPDALLAREAAQLALLQGVDGVRVCPPAGYARGVLFTEPTPGRTLAETLLADPGSAEQALAAAAGVLGRIHAAGLPLGEVASPERSIAGTFHRKTNGLSGQVYLQRLGTGRLDDVDEQAHLAVEVSAVVARVRRVAFSALGRTPAALAYGDAKPEHLLYPHGPDGPVLLLDPGLQHAPATVDTAKLISRLVLHLVAMRPHPAGAVDAITGQLTALRQPPPGLSDDQRAAWGREVLVLWLMDSLNILTTYLSAPPALALPPLGAAVAARPWPHVRLLEQLARGMTGPGAWTQALISVNEAAQ